MQLLFMIVSLFVTVMGCTMDDTHKEMQTKNILILLGPPGSGKGTQADKISQKFKIPHISTGDLFRENLKAETSLGKKAKRYLDSGKLVPDEVVLEMLFDRISQSDSQEGYLLDGFPRTIPQAEAFDASLVKNDSVKVILLDVSDDLIIKRIEGRLTCLNCNASYNVYFSPPKEDEVCDRCGQQLAKRKDDKLEVIQERLRVYHQQTEPLIDYYHAKSLLLKVDGNQSQDLVYANLMNVLTND